MMPVLATVSLSYPDSLGVVGRSPRYLSAFVIALVAALVLTPGVRRLAVRFGMVDQPDARRVHMRPTPRGGGLAVFIGFHLSLVLTLLLPGLSSAAPFAGNWLGVFFLASFVLLLVGFLDDLFSLKPWLKLMGQILAASILYANHIRFNSFFTVGMPEWADYLFTMLWFLGAINAFNLIDGMDGLAAGLALIASMGMAGSLFFRGYSLATIPFLALAGACLGFLRYNFHPASVFLGDTGSMFLGLTLATLALVTASKQEMVASLGVPLLAMGVPIFDTVLAIWRRSVRSALPGMAAGGAKRVRVMQADREHVHHRILARTMNQRRAALLLYVFNALLVVIGIAAALLRKRAPGIYLVAFIVAAFLIVRQLARVELLDTGRLLARTRRVSLARGLLVPLYVFIDVCALTAVWIVARLVTFLPVTRAACLTSLPLMVGSVFLSLALVRTYERAWSRAVMREYALLSVAVTAGTLLGAGITMVLEGFEMGGINFIVVFGLAAHFPVLGVRALRETLHDIAAAAERNALMERPTAVRMLAYGGGERFRIFRLEQRAQSGRTQRVVVGILDDEINLRERIIQGVRVVGTIDDLPSAVREHRAQMVIVTAVLTPEKRDYAMRLARLAQVPLVEWGFQETTL